MRDEPKTSGILLNIVSYCSAMQSNKKPTTTLRSSSYRKVITNTNCL